MALNINEDARKQANLRLLQRTMDPSISDILGSATHVVLYKYQDQWEKLNIEGSLFLAVRSSGYLLVILNRNSTENFKVELSANFQLQHNDPYLIFKQPENSQTTIRGIWFPNAKERLLMNDLLTSILDHLKSAPPPNANIDHGAAFAALLSPLSIGTAAATTPAAAKPPQGKGTATPPIRQASPSQQSNHQPTLDKKSLQLALLSLIQDDRFLDLLHAQYLKVQNRREAGNRNNP